MTQNRASSLAVLQQWRRTCSSVSTNDALFPVISKALEAMDNLIKPDVSENDFVRAMSSFECELRNSLLFDGRKDAPVRGLTYGLLKCLLATLREVAADGWQPVWSSDNLLRFKVKTEPGIRSTDDAVDPTSVCHAKIVRRDEPAEEYPLFRDLPRKEVKVKVELEDEEDRPLRAEIDRPDRSPAFLLAPPKRRMTARMSCGGKAPRRELPQQRSKSPSSSRVGGVKREGGEGGEGAVKKEKGEKKEKKKGGGRVEKKRSPTKKGLYGCTMCEWHYGNSPATVISHLRSSHGSTPTTAGLYFRCSCGFVSRSNNHSRSCKEKAYTLVKDVDVPFAPKRTFSNNLPRRVKKEESKDSDSKTSMESTEIETE